MDSGQAPGSVTVTARSLADYRNMFALDDAELLAGPILDCPGGASSFAAEVGARGGQVVSVDPVYRLGAAHIADRVRVNLQNARQIFAETTLPIEWDYLVSTETYVRASQVAATRFQADFTSNGSRYLAALLPELPFADSSFELALVSHLLFVYDTHLSFAEHLSAILELVRVSPGGVRVHPVVESSGRQYGRMDDLRAALGRLNVHTDIKPVTATWIAGAAQMLICRKR